MIHTLCLFKSFLNLQITKKSTAKKWPLFWKASMTWSFPSTVPQDLCQPLPLGVKVPSRDKTSILPGSQLGTGTFGRFCFFNLQAFGWPKMMTPLSWTKKTTVCWPVCCVSFYRFLAFKNVSYQVVDGTINPRTPLSTTTERHRQWRPIVWVDPVIHQMLLALVFVLRRVMLHK